MPRALRQGDYVEPVLVFHLQAIVDAQFYGTPRMLVDLLKSCRNLPEGHDRLDQVIGLEATLDQESQRLGLNPARSPSRSPAAVRCWPGSR